MHIDIHFYIFQCGKYLYAIYVRAISIPDSPNWFPVLRKAIRWRMSSWKEGQCGTKCFLSWFLSVQKENLNKRWNCICCGKRTAIWNIFGALCPRYITGLTMETYLNWPRRKKSGKTDNENFSVSLILHVAFFGRHKIWYQRTAPRRLHPKGAIKHSQLREGKDFCFKFGLSTSLHSCSIIWLLPSC